MAPDDRCAPARRDAAEVTQRLLESPGSGELEKSRALLGYPDDTAGRYNGAETTASISPDMTAGRPWSTSGRTGRGKETLNVVTSWTRPAAWWRT